MNYTFHLHKITLEIIIINTTRDATQKKIFSLPRLNLKIKTEKNSNSFSLNTKELRLKKIKMNNFKILLLCLSIFVKLTNCGSPEAYLTFCKKYFDVFDTNSRYFETSCFVDITADWDTARRICEVNNMILSPLFNAAVQDTILKSSAQVYGAEKPKTMWINGNKAISGNWTVYAGTNSQRYQWFGRLAWVNSTAQNLGNCMTITNSNGQFKVSSSDCSSQFSFICSFNRTVVFI